MMSFDLDGVLGRDNCIQRSVVMVIVSWLDAGPHVMLTPTKTLCYLLLSVKPIYLVDSYLQYAYPKTWVQSYPAKNTLRMHSPTSCMRNSCSIFHANTAYGWCAIGSATAWTLSTSLLQSVSCCYPRSWIWQRQCLKPHRRRASLLKTLSSTEMPIGQY